MIYFQEMMSGFISLITALIGLGIAVFIFFLLLRLWKALGLLMEVLNIFLARHRALWDTLNAIREQRNRGSQSERE